MFHLLFLYLPSSTCSLCNHHDNSALLQFKHSIVVNTSHYYSWLDVCSSSSPKIESWRNGTDCCQWEGVTCDTKSGHVISLDLSCSHIQGKFHPNNTIFRLRHLQNLNLAYNDFSGSLIFPGIGDLVNLMHLNLSFSVINGDIPSTMSHLSKLVSLDLSSDWGSVDDPMPNYITRFDPYTWNKLIQNATNLREIRLDGVDMSSITESSLSLLVNLSSSLVFLSLGSTKLQGIFSSDILCLPNLQRIDLSYNKWLTGELPKSNLSNLLSYLDLSYTAFSGQISNSIGNLKSLSHLDLGKCTFEGLIPSSLFHLTQLSLLDLSDNELVGPIPSKITSLSKLHTLALAGNKLNGTIPRWFYSLPSLSYLNLYGNQLRGSIAEFSTYSLEYLYLSDNKLQGNLPIPPNGIEYFLVSNNELTGDIPSTMCNASTLNMLNLAHNNLTGKIPQCLGAFPYLSVLDLQMNNLYGNIPRKFSKENAFVTIKLNGNHLKGPLPQSLAHCTNLQVLDLGNNNIEDTFPHWLETLQQLQVLSLRSNKFHGEIPKFIGELHSLKGLNLSHNAISGTIPQPLSYLRNLEWLDLSCNQLTGEIPMDLTNLNFLAVLNLSQNQFEGIIPTGGQFNTFENDSYVGNPMLCGFPLSKSCNEDGEWKPHSTFHNEEFGFGWKVVVVGYAIGMLFGMLLGYFMFLTGKPQWLARLVEGLLYVRVKRTNNTNYVNRGMN
uniref:LRR receptor-like serine/threonine-protein kinase GSO1 n=1 Tax=Cajanus cajan TaxID=3821 RepID=A0A151TVF7_CAJCA|nr:LRR receptor-like serine/threonine-protein kinase GSO1 [Cajanus cajan]